MRAIVFDTETTALVENRVMHIDKRPRVIEIYACRVDLDAGDEPEAEFHSLVNPGIPLPAKIRTITGITPEMLDGAPPFSDIAGPLWDFLRVGVPLIAHNAAFDKEMLANEFERAGKAVPPADWPPVWCSLESTMHIKSRRLSLGDLYTHLFRSEKHKDAHRAKADVLALVRIARELHRQDLL